jgi:hypothetical protein
MTLSITTFSITTFSIMTFGITKFSIMTFGIMKFSTMKFSITKFSIMKFSLTKFSITKFSMTTFSMKILVITAFSISTFSITIQLNDMQHYSKNTTLSIKDTQHNDTVCLVSRLFIVMVVVGMLSLLLISSHYPVNCFITIDILVNRLLNSVYWLLCLLNLYC